MVEREQPTGNPAVTLRDVGERRPGRGLHLRPRPSVVQTRQGNPAWAGQERDGQRADPRPTTCSSVAPQPDWLDLTAAIPQADEQQRLLANLITEMARTPMPRFWYLPNGLQGGRRAHR